MINLFFRRVLFIPTVILLLTAAATFNCPAEEDSSDSPLDVIRKYKEALETSTDTREVADAHYQIGLALEKLGRETEATAEYLKIIINYPHQEDINKKAEKRLAALYAGFSKKAKELTQKFEPSEEGSDPTIFFAYIKSLHENYRNLGQYDRAMNVLQKLYDMDPDNEAYLIDMGNIYLHGYNDADKAIFYFKKLLEKNPDHPSAYVNLGMAYEKKGDYENAIKAYQKEIEVSPVSQWSMYSLRRIEGINLTRDKELIKDWYFLGPFDNSDRKGVEKHFLPEDKIDIEETYEGKNKVAAEWRRPFDYGSSGYADLNSLFGINDYAVAYALTYIYSPKERDVQLRVGSDEGIKIWLNDKVIFSYTAERSAEVDDDIIKAHLEKGWNRILVKVSDTWGSWGFYFRITNLDGKPMDDLVFDPLRDDKRLYYIYGELKRQKRFRFTRIAAIYAIAVSALLFGFYLMVSNIYGRIKINRMKEDFISSVSHELKTPISAIKMLAETLKRGKVKKDERKDQYYDMIINESDRLTRFINKILDFSKIEKGGKVFYFEKADIVDLAKTAIGIYRDEAQDENLKMSLSAPKDAIYAAIDKDAILQVILNLVDNAYKYSPEEKAITIGVKEDEKSVFIEVIDKGLGIPKNDIEKIFDKFYRIDRDTIKGIKGSGLGLAFVKSVVDAHGGRIGVESESARGTKFVISLPAERA